MRFYRRSLLVIVWLSLLMIPVMLINYLCYAGLCGGPAAWEIRRNYGCIISLMGYGTWVYPIIVFGALIYSRKKAHRVFSTGILWVPLVCLSPIFFALYRTLQIEGFV